MTEKTLKVKRRDTSRYPQTEKLSELVTENETARLSIVLPRSKRQALKIKAVTEGRTIQAIVNQLIDEYLNK